MKDYYKVLMISPEAPQEMVAKAYRVMAHSCHPDRNPPGKQKWAEEKMKELNEAYAVLSDPVKRAAYDEKLRRQEVQVEPPYDEPDAPERPVAADAEPIITGDAVSDWQRWGREYFDRREDFMSAVYSAPMTDSGDGHDKRKSRTSRWRRKKKESKNLSL